ncbi:MAG: hypothetical protein K2X29_06495 [Candidatus Obscuribacterales bacterium]|nr:hypothetical protein [Candidatus Obscuribacterales bacterium]
MTSKNVIVKAFEKLFGANEAPAETHTPQELQVISNRLKQLRTSFQNPRAKRQAKAQVFFGASRRAIDLMPAQLAHSEAETTQTSQVRFHQLLINVEGSQVTGCFKVVSPITRSRSSILLYRGRALGCVFGERTLKHQLFGEEGLACALEDLSSPDNTLIVHQLPEDIVLAAASLFQGQPLSISYQISAQDYFQAAMDMLLQSGSPGCIVVKQKHDDAMAMVYINRNKTVGIYSNRDGWQDPKQMKSLFDLTGTDDVEITGSVLLVQSGEQAYLLGMSLSGLSNRRFAVGRGTDSLQAKVSARQHRWHSKKDNRGFINQPEHEALAEPGEYQGIRSIQTISSSKYSYSIKP